MGSGERVVTEPEPASYPSRQKGDLPDGHT